MSLALRKGSSTTGISKAGVGARSNALGYEVLLQEMLAKAGCDPDDPNPDVKRLACHMQLLKELHRNGAFGTLSGLMTMVLKEIMKSLYTEEIIADPLTSGASSSTSAMAHLPFFAMLAVKESQLGEIARQAEAIHIQEQRRDAQEEELRGEIRSLRDRERSLQATVTRLEYEVAKAKQIAESALEDTDLTRGKDQAAIKCLTQELNLARKEANAAMAENKMLQAREDVEKRMRGHFANANQGPGSEQGLETEVSSEIAVLIKQLLVLQNGRVDDFESRMDMAMAAAIPKPEQIQSIKSIFAQEMNALHFEVKELLAHQEGLGREVKLANTLPSMIEGYDKASDSEDEVVGKEDGAYAPKAPPKDHAMWEVFHLIAEGD